MTNITTPLLHLKVQKNGWAPWPDKNALEKRKKVPCPCREFNNFSVTQPIP
jgi:hypothetical protein